MHIKGIEHGKAWVHKLQFYHMSCQTFVVFIYKTLNFKMIVGACPPTSYSLASPLVKNHGAIRSITRLVLKDNNILLLPLLVKCCANIKRKVLFSARLCTARNVAVEQTRAEKFDTVNINGFFGGRRLVIRRW